MNYQRKETIEGATLYLGDSREVLREIPDNSADSVVTDPPYALVSIVKRFGGKDAAPTRDGDVYSRASSGFMGQKWDTGETAFDPEFWREVMRVLKPGGHVIAASGTRTYHRLAVAIEDAGFDLGPGFEIRDMITNWIASDTLAGRFLDSLSEEQMRALLLATDESDFVGMLGWLYGSGFPKSHDVSKGIDKAAGNTREVVGRKPHPRYAYDATDAAGSPMGNLRVSVGAGERHRVAGDITAPASPEAEQWAGWGTALKPACEPWVLARKPLGEKTVVANVLTHGTGAINIDGCRVSLAHDDSLQEAVHHRPGALDTNDAGWGFQRVDRAAGLGRFPANVIHDGSDEVVNAFPNAPGQMGVVTGNEPSSPFGNVYGDMPNRAGVATPRGDSGSAARFFYSAKADAMDRLGSKHPTVKPVDLMQYLCRLVTPPGGTVLDPFAGSGSTGEAAIREGFRPILIERESAYFDDIVRRMGLVLAGPQSRKNAMLKAKGRVEDSGGLFGAAA